MNATAPKSSFLKTHKKWLITALVLAVLAVLAYVFFKPSEEAPQYLTATVETGDIERSIMATGKIEAITRVDVGSDASGKLEMLAVDVGSEVKKGEIIAQIEQVNQQNAVSNASATLTQSQSALQAAHSELASREAQAANARANLANRQAQAVKAQRHLERLTPLVEIDAISRQEYDDAHAALAAANAAVASAYSDIRTADAAIHSARANVQSQHAAVQKSQTDVNSARSTLARTVITAPIDGTVISVSTKQGQTVIASQSAPTIVTLANLKRVRIKAQISEADVINLSAGLPAKFNIIGNVDQKFDATLSAIEPAAEKSASSSAVYYIGYLDVDNADGRFRLDMTTQVNIIIEQAKNTLIIPAAAISQKGDKSFVRIVGSDGKASESEVRVGINNHVNAQILSGLRAGDIIVLSEGEATHRDRRRVF